MDLPRLQGSFRSALTIEQRRRAAMNRKRALALRRTRVAFPTRPLPYMGAPNGLFNMRMGGIEKKFNDYFQPTTNLAAGSAIYNINGIAQGTDYNQRIGREIFQKSLYLRMFGADVTGTSTQVRVMLVFDKQTNGVLPLISDILTSVSLLACNNLNNRERFVTISDKQFITSGTNAGPSNSFMNNKYKKIRLPVTFNNTGSTIADINTGALYLVIIAQNAFSGLLTNTLNFSFVARTRFTDQ